MKKTIRLYLPLLILLFVAVFLLRGLWLDPKKLPSVFIDKPLPTFNLPLLEGMPTPEGFTGASAVRNQALMGKPWVLNVFASWCQACIVEHPRLLEMARSGQVLLVGVAYKDDSQATRNWLAKHGNPYDLVLEDSNGRAGIEFGVYGVPETFVVDHQGVVRYKNVGPIDTVFFEQYVKPLIHSGGAFKP